MSEDIDEKGRRVVRLGFAERVAAVSVLVTLIGIGVVVVRFATTIDARGVSNGEAIERQSQSIDELADDLRAVTDAGRMERLELERRIAARERDAYTIDHARSDRMEIDSAIRDAALQIRELAKVQNEMQIQASEDRANLRALIDRFDRVLSKLESTEHP